MPAARSVETDHIYTPSHQLCNVVNAYSGLVDLSTLPSYYQPLQSAYEITAWLIDLSTGDNPSINLIFDGDDSDYDIESSLEGRPLSSFGLSLIIGPPELHTMVGDNNGPQSLLWDRGSVRNFMVHAMNNGLNTRVNQIYAGNRGES